VDTKVRKEANFKMKTFIAILILSFGALAYAEGLSESSDTPTDLGVYISKKVFDAVMTVFRVLLEATFTLFGHLGENAYNFFNYFLILSQHFGAPTTVFRVLLESTYTALDHFKENTYNTFDSFLVLLGPFGHNFLNSLSTLISALNSLAQGGGVEPVNDAVEDLLALVQSYLVTELANHVNGKLNMLFGLVTDALGIVSDLSKTW